METKRKFFCLIFFVVFIEQCLSNNFSQLQELINGYEGDHSKLLVVFDIDDTILSNSNQIKYHGKYSIPHTIAHQDHANLQQISNVRNIYDWLIQNEVGVAFITYRCETARFVTLKNLFQQNFLHWKELVLFPQPCDYQKISAQKFKTDIRKQLTEQGYHIVGAIGDQWSDIEGGFVDLPIKLDNVDYITN